MYGTSYHLIIKKRLKNSVLKKIEKFHQSKYNKILKLTNCDNILFSHLTGAYL